MDGEFNLGDMKTTDFSNPMYEALGNGEGNKETANSKQIGLYEIADEILDRKVHNEEHVFKTPSKGSAILSPSSIVHRSSPQVQIRQTALNPTSVDTDKDTQKLVEEDKSEC